MSYCTQCGKPVSGRARFCTNCGARIVRRTHSAPKPELSGTEAAEPPSAPVGDPPDPFFRALLPAHAALLLCMPCLAFAVSEWNAPNAALDGRYFALVGSSTFLVALVCGIAAVLACFVFATTACKNLLLTGNARRAGSVAKWVRRSVWTLACLGFVGSLVTAYLYRPYDSRRRATNPEPYFVVPFDEEPKVAPPRSPRFEGSRTGTANDGGRETIQLHVEERRQGSQSNSSPGVSPAVESILASMVDIPGKGFKMGKTEVTQAQWVAIMGNNPSEFKGRNNPVEQVSWNDCQRFLSLLNLNPVVKDSGLTFRLPTDEEWEYACRAGATGDYCKLANGTEITGSTLGQVAWFEDNSDEKTHPVGQKQPNAFGLYDMHGNVWEWTSTVDGEWRVSRGGSWLDSAGRCESSSGNWSSPSYRYFPLGFRLCASRRAD